MSSSLDITCPSPRVNFQSLGQFVGKRVTIVGSVVGVDGNTLQLKTSDDQVVNIQMQGAVPQCKVLEVQGMVASPNTVTEESCCPFGDNFDMANYNELCKLVNNPAYRTMFHP
ncbi:hypothetical protein D9Q98_006254 [Chlorella vulgaris]|uniref:Replication factor A protein 3 n=1 Tax=Chlorella vulgaris TaxID=3077 RepID=A0A9D4Z0Q0_CHLVU|nr:hypothetical protein D9Q98_006254 [Chlorella vulgaris]